MFGQMESTHDDLEFKKNITEINNSCTFAVNKVDISIFGCLKYFGGELTSIFVVPNFCHM